MPEQVTEKLQPCLLDRLTDQHPDKQMEGTQDRVVSFRRYREAVFRDLHMLLTSPRPEFEEGVLEEFDQIATSVVNYGVHNLCGRVSTSLDLHDLARDLRTAISAFEPRINAASLSVEAIIDHWKNTGHELIFEVRGDLWANPAPQELIIRTKLDLETGDFALSEEKAT
jgi:type VI secretion system protein ImpF